MALKMRPNKSTPKTRTSSQRTYVVQTKSWKRVEKNSPPVPQLPKVCTRRSNRLRKAQQAPPPPTKNPHTENLPIENHPNESLLIGSQLLKKTKGKMTEPQNERALTEKEPTLFELFKRGKRAHTRPWNKLRLNIKLKLNS